MDYDYRNRHSSTYRPAASTASLYPRIGPQHAAPAPAGRPPYVQPQSNPPPSSSGVGIRVAIKPEYLITPPPQMAPQMAEVPRSTFHFDFEFEKKILVEAEKDGFHNWSRIATENQPPKVAASNSSEGPVNDPVMDKYLRSGLGRDAVSLALLNYGDNPVKVREFVKGYNLLREMGFTSKNAAEALAMYDNNEDKALAHLLNQ